jgi:hypothetical protein
MRELENLVVGDSNIDIEDDTDEPMTIDVR